VDNDGQRYIADRNLPLIEYLCPVCSMQVILKKGEIIRPHFSHLKDHSCSNSGESLNHLKMKSIAYQKLLDKNFNNIYLEQIAQNYPEKRIIDIVVQLKDRKIAVELQHSPLSIEVFIERTKSLLDLGFYPLWIFDHETHLTLYQRGRGRFIRLKKIFSFLYELGFAIVLLDISKEKFYRLDITGFKWLSRDDISTTLAFFNDKSMEIDMLLKWPINPKLFSQQQCTECTMWIRQGSMHSCETDFYRFYNQDVYKLFRHFICPNCQSKQFPTYQEGWFCVNCKNKIR